MGLYIKRLVSVDFKFIGKNQAIIESKINFKCESGELTLIHQSHCILVGLNKGL